VEHKIQSSGGGLSLVLDQVPKIIKPLVKEWAPLAFTVSFKLETDSTLLVSKSKAALDRYGHQIVVGNMLTTRKHVVWFITKDLEQEIRLSQEEINSHVEIETHIVGRLVEMHQEWIQHHE
jgi:phosphopantothenate-cysteine ligase